MTGPRLRLLALLAMITLVTPIVYSPMAAAYTPGDEAAVFGHTFAEEYWTNSSIVLKTSGANATFTASYVHVDDFQAFLLAFNKINTSEGKQIILPYQLFGMHYVTPGGEDVFIGAIFAFLLIHNESYGNNNLPDVGNEHAWYVVPMSNDNPWPEYTPNVESIPVSKISDNHYRFGMRYTNLTARIVSADSTGAFLATLAIPFLRVLISELTVQYDIIIDADGTVHAETLYTIGQVEKAQEWKLFHFVDVDPQELIIPSMEISAVHYLSVFTSKYNVTSASTGHTLQPPTATKPLTDNISIKVGDDNERAFDIGLGRSYSLINQTTNPWTTVSDNETALNALVAAPSAGFALVAWQAPFSGWVFAHMAYGLSEQVRTRYHSVQGLINNSTAEFASSQWWYAVSFPEWNGLRIYQDPTYTATTNLGTTTTSTGFKLTGTQLIIIGVVVVVIVAIAAKKR
ncbi:MAG: hypothetical protein K9W43_05680 [Candidatus Thorarchaeota archaeon]|nr:hypothetical protein [Candidatus Thorarchaeota archaeon]